METGCRSPVLWRRGSAAQTGKRKRGESAQWLWPLLAPVGLGLGIAGGESWADPAIVSPNGLPVQVNPTFSEPGLPAFSFPQGGLSDTGGVEGAVTTGGSGSGTDSASLGSYSGAGAGVAGAIVASGYADMLGESVGTGQCVALAQATSDVGYTSTWSPGAQVEGDTDIAVGTVIATFGSDGTYTNTYGQSHTAIYLGQGDQGIFVEDQWLGQAAGTRWIPWTTSNSYESGSKFRLSSNLIVNKYGGYQQVFAMHHIGSLVFLRQYLAKFMFARNRRQQWTTHTG